MSERPIPPMSDERATAQRSRRLTTCKRWSGALGPKPCRAGVDLVRAVGPRVQPGWLQAIPCLDSSAPAFVCEHKVTPTAEEVEVAEREIREAGARTLAVMAAIPAGPPGSQGEMPCPKCGGTVRWLRSAYNGHLSGACPTGCVAFMQ